MKQPQDLVVLAGVITCFYLLDVAGNPAQFDADRITEYRYLYNRNNLYLYYSPHGPFPSFGKGWTWIHLTVMLVKCNFNNVVCVYRCNMYV